MRLCPFLSYRVYNSVPKILGFLQGQEMCSKEFLTYRPKIRKILNILLSIYYFPLALHTSPNKMFHSATGLISRAPRFLLHAKYMATLKPGSVYTHTNPITLQHTHKYSPVLHLLPVHSHTRTLLVKLKALFDLDSEKEFYLFPLLLPINKTYLHFWCPQNTVPFSLLLPIEDPQVIGFSFVSIATLALSTIYSRETQPLPCLVTAQC